MDDKKTKPRFNFFSGWLNFNNAESLTWKGVVILTAGAYVLSCLMRYTWISLVHNIQSVYWNGQIMINTADGFYWANLAKDALAGMADGRLFARESGLPMLAYLLTKYLSIPLETVMLYLPIFVSSLIVIPIVLIGRLYKNSWWGFFSALVVTGSWGYYNRTLAGYFDTDMFVLPILAFTLYFLLAASKQRNLTYLLLTTLTIIVAPYFYPNLLTMSYPLIVCYIGYNVIWHWKDAFTWISILFLSIALGANLLWTRLPIHNYALSICLLFIFVGAVFAALKFIKAFQRHYKIIMCLSILALTALIFFSGPIRALLINRVNLYFNRGADQTVQTYGLAFRPFINAVNEADGIAFPDFSRRLIGSMTGLLLAVAGFVILVIKKSQFLIGLPLVGLSLLAFNGGSRFVIFAAPLAGLGAVYLIIIVISWLSERYAWLNKTWTTCLLALLAVGTLLFPNIKHISEFMPGPLLQTDRVQALEILKQTGKPSDFVISWWDYGTAIQFYSGLRTVVDPGQQEPNALFALSEILTTSSQQKTANLSRWIIERHLQSPYYYFYPSTPENKDPVKFIADATSNKFALPKKTTDVFLFLPIDLMNLSNALIKASNIDLFTGAPLRDVMFVNSDDYALNGMKASVPQGNFSVDFNALTLKQGATDLPVKAFHLIYNNADGQLQVKNITKNSSADLHVIMMRDLHKLIILDDKLFNSSLIQLLLFRNYDAKLFEPIVQEQTVAIYKLKI